MTNELAKQRVLAVYPRAYAAESSTFSLIFICLPSGKPISFSCETEQAAWQNAAESLPAEPEQEDCACGRAQGSHHYTYHSEESCGVGPVASVEAKEKRSDLCCFGNGECKEVQTHRSFYCKHHEPLSSFEPKPTPSTSDEQECPVCYWKMSEPASDYNICPRCGTEFENDDEDKTHEQLRRDWINAGAKFFFKLKPQPDSSSTPDWEQEIKDISIAFIEGREISDVSKNVVIRNLVWAIKNRTKPQTELGDSSSISTEQTFEEWWDLHKYTVYSEPKAAHRATWNAAKGQSDGR